MSEDAKSYGQIFRSSSVMAAAQVVQYGVGFVRTKVVAVVLGPAGVGVVGMYLAIAATVNTVAGLGLSSSGVRTIAEAEGAGDHEASGVAVVTMRRASWMTGIVGAVALSLLALPISQASFGTSLHAGNLGWLGLLVIVTALDAGEASILQGTRRVGDLARRTIGQAVLATIVTIGGYLWLGEDGIVPVLIAAAVVSYAVSAWLGRRVPVPHSAVPWADTLTSTRGLIALGLAFMWSALVVTGSTLAIRSLVVQRFGIEASGLYQAAWSLSGMFAALILTAMGADFYPRLAAVAHDHPRMNDIVNQQTEIGVMLALPGLLGTLTLAPWVIRLTYSAEFAAATPLLSWFVLGVLGRVVAWPMGFVLMATKAARTFAVVETAFGLLHLALAFGLMQVVGLPGVAIAFFVLYMTYTLVMMVITRRMTGLRWSAGAIQLVTVAGVMAALGAALQYLPDPWRSACGIVLTGAGTVFSLRMLSVRLGPDHRIVRVVARLPGGTWLTKRPPS